MEEESASVASLEADILVHIFHKLPIKCVHRCKVVCREWLSLVSDPLFKSNYKPCSIPNHPPNLIMIPKRNRNLSPLAYDDISTPRVARPQPLPISWTFTSRDHVQIIGSCNGLVALYRHPGDFCLFNPCTTGEDHITVHVPMGEPDEYRWYNWELSGLCYDNVNDEYKAVVRSYLYLDDQCFYVVSFKNGSYTLKTQPQMQNLQIPWGRGISGTIVKNVPYWVFWDIALDRYLIFYFDSKMEEFIEAPKLPNGELKILGLGTLGGQLTLSLKSDLGLEVWGFKEHENGEWCWSMLFVIKFEFRRCSSLAWMVQEDEVLLDVNEEELMVYNVRDGSLRQLQRRMRRSSYNMLAYLPTFISPI